MRAPQQRAQAVGGVALPALGRVRPQQRRQGRHLHRQVRPRQDAGAVALELRLLGPAPRRAHQRLQRVRAAVGVALRLGLGDGRLAEQVDGAGHAVLPQVAQHAERGPRVLADDEPVRHVLHARGGRRPQRRTAGLRAPHLHGDADRRGRGLDLAEEAGQVAGEVVEVPAGGHDVHEPEQRGLQLGVLRGEVHRLLVERLEGIARDGHGGRQALADLVQLRLQGALVHHVREHYGRDAPRAGTGLDRRADARRGGDRQAVPRARGGGARGRPVRARDRRRRQPRRHPGRAGGARRRRPAGQGRHAVAQLRPSGGAHRRARARERRRRGDARRRPPGPARADPGDARPLARRGRRRVRGPQPAPGRDGVQARDRERVLPAVPPRGRHRPHPRVGRLPADGPPPARRAAGDARAQPLPARDERVGGLHADRGHLRARAARQRADEVHARPDAPLQLRRDHELLAPPAAVRDPARVRVLGARLPRHPAHDRRALRGHLRARRPHHDRDRPAAGRDPADLRGDHRRVRRPHLRRGQAPAAVRRAQEGEPR